MTKRILERALMAACVKISDKDIENDRRTNEDWYQYFVNDANEKAKGNPEHQRILDVAEEIVTLVIAKNITYGNSFNKSGDVLRILYPNGVPTIQYDDMLCVVRIVDKLFRIANDKEAFDESPYRDIAGYGILGACREGNIFKNPEEPEYYPNHKMRNPDDK